VRAYSVFANEDSKAVSVNFSEEFLELSNEDRLDILADAMSQLKCVQYRLIQRIRSAEDERL
jgi:hypothetical protein